MANLIIHGHFYQPPREDPWTGRILRQYSAYPYHDWNEKVNAESYAPCSVARILNPAGKIIRLVNLYEQISFNFGPTLLGWMENASPGVYRAIIRADRKSRKERSGHGNAIAQCYSHMIMPLADRRDKKTQIRWGITDFIHRFGRRPEGMWLPETAVDMETLELMAEEGISFVILAPHQAKRYRRPGGEWIEPAGKEGPADLDTGRPYRVDLQEGRDMAVFFYDGPLSHDIAFGGLLKDGEAFAERLFQEAEEKGLLNIATDGETYGHHQKFGEMALAYALMKIQEKGGLELRNYGEFLEEEPPGYEVEINEFTSWSCVHGVERWRSDCGCTTDSRPGWSQKWRAPLREGLNWLRDRFREIYYDVSDGLLTDPDEARDSYLDLLLKGEEGRKAFEDRFVPAGASTDNLYPLMEMARAGMLMFTSCGWFFSDISRIETIQILGYAARGIELARGVSGKDLTEGFLEFLAEAESNVEGEGSGADIYRRRVLPQKEGLRSIVVSIGFRMLFDGEERPIPGEAGNFRIGIIDRRDDETSKRVKVETLDRLTRERRIYLCAAAFRDGGKPMAAVLELDDTLNTSSLLDMELESLLSDMEQSGGCLVSLDDLSTDDRAEVLYGLKRKVREDLRERLGDFFRQNSRGIFLLYGPEEPLSRDFQAAMEILALEELRLDGPDRTALINLLLEMKKWRIPGTPGTMEMLLRKRLEREMEVLAHSPSPEAALEMEEIVGLSRELVPGLNLWTVQNIFHRIYRDELRKGESGIPGGMVRLGELLGFDMDAIEQVNNE